MSDFSRDSSMLEMFIYEMGQLVEQLEQLIIESEEAETLSEAAINEIFRIMHTIKGSAAMMLYNNIADTSHKIEDMFFYIRENHPAQLYKNELTDIVLEAIDFVKDELGKIQEGQPSDGDGTSIMEDVKEFMAKLKGDSAPKPEPKPAPQPKTDAPVGETSVYDIIVRFEAGCGQENERAYDIIKQLEPITLDIDYAPRGIDQKDKASECMKEIRSNGFNIRLFSNAALGEVNRIISGTVKLSDYTIDDGAGNKAGKTAENKTVNEIVKAPQGAGKEKISRAGEPSVSREIEEATGNAANNFKIMVKFEDGCEMENIRSYTVLRNLEQIATGITYNPPDILENEDTAEIIRRMGFRINLNTNETYDRVKKILEETVFLKEMTIDDANAGEKKQLVRQKDEEKKPEAKAPEAKAGDGKKPMGGAMISVNINKLDALLNLTGELVTSEAMVTQNPDLEGLELENFQKAVRQLRKIINDIQDTVMSMRMVPLSPTFAKMHRIVRDMCKQLGKDVTLELIGEDTEVDKNIIEHISDPLMHLIRNSVDHGIESVEERRAKNKPEKGLIVLEARNAGGDVLITVRDDGAGIDKYRVMNKAKSNGLLRKSESEYTDKEIYGFIFAPGFSTNEEVTAYSGRGVGMDVVTTNIEQVGGSVIVDSEQNQGTTTTLKIPLTLAIINGMIVEINNAKYTIPINTIKESFKATESEILTDPDGNEMIMVRGECYNVLRLHDFFGLECEPLKVDDGIMIMLENDEQTIVVLANELIGEQQVVVKAIPKYIKKPKGLSGCTLLGNGDISLIVDSAGFFNI